MALLFMDGFDHYNTALLPQMWDYASGPSVTTTNARNGNSLYCNENSAVILKNFSNRTTFIVGAAFRFANVVNSTNTSFLQIMDGGSLQVGLRLNTLGSLEVVNQSTILGSSSVNTILPNSYYYIEFKGTIANSISADTCKVMVNGAEVINVAAASDTQSTANTFWNRVLFTSNIFYTASGGTTIDDIYIADASGTTNNDFLGDVRVVTLFPSANGDSSQWTNSNNTSVSNYTYVDETSPNDDTDYVKAGTVGLVDLYNYGNLPTVTDIFGVQQCSYARKDASGTQHVKNVQKIGSTVHEGALINLTESYKYYTDIYDVSPDTATAWTDTEINGAQFGIETVS